MDPDISGRQGCCMREWGRYGGRIEHAFFFLFSSLIGIYPNIQSLLPPLLTAFTYTQHIILHSAHILRNINAHAHFIFQTSIFLLILPSPICQQATVYFFFSTSLSLNFPDLPNKLVTQKQQILGMPGWLSELSTRLLVSVLVVIPGSLEPTFTMEST